MNLQIPEQIGYEDGDIPAHPRKFKKWLAEIPQANMGEITRQIFGAIRELNRKEIPAKHRLEIMEMLRTPVRSIFDNLKKYFINRTFPLPEKSEKIVNLNQSLLKEIAQGYKIIVQQAYDESEKIDNKNVTTSIARAIKYQSELFLRANEIYASVPENIWHDTHQMFAYAVKNKLHKNSVADNENPDKKTTIENLYKQILLFSLSRPAAMRQSDTVRVYNKLHKWSELCNLSFNIKENQVNQLFCVRLDEDQPPSYLSQKDYDSNNPILILDTTKLVNSINKEINNARSGHDTITVGDELSTETLKALALAWGVMPKRRFSRAGKQGHIAAAIGLAHASKMISDSNLPESMEKMSNSFDADSSFSLEHIPEQLKAMSETPSGYMTHTEIGSPSNNAWDMVARGTVMTDAFEKQRQIRENERVKLNKEEDDLHWEVVNVSAGGYCLRWNSNTTSKAQIGELIALREREKRGGYEWHVGVIRWMQFTANNGLEIGVQVLSPKVVAAKAFRLNRRDEAPFESIMVPGIKPLKQAATIILPAHAFKTDDKLKVEVFDQKIEIKLSEKKEHTGSFTQFQFAHIEQLNRNKKIQKKEDASKKKDDFDEIWSSL